MIQSNFTFSFTRTQKTNYFDECTIDFEKKIERQWARFFFCSNFKLKNQNEILLEFAFLENQYTFCNVHMVVLVAM